MKHNNPTGAILVAMLVMILALSMASNVLAAAPSNDDFDNATLFSGLPFTDSINTSEATTAPDDPYCEGNGPTVWYVYTPTADQLVSADTFGSNYDTTLSVYTGTRGSLSQVACNDDANSLQSQVKFYAAAGETYYFMIGAFASGPGGSLVFNASAAEPLAFDLIVNPTGRVKASTGVMTVSGKVTCSRPAYVDVYGSVQQRAGRLLIHGFYYASVFCEGSTGWSASFAGENGIFKPGKAELSAEAYAWAADDYEFASDFAALTVRFRGQGR